MPPVPFLSFLCFYFCFHMCVLSSVVFYLFSVWAQYRKSLSDLLLVSIETFLKFNFENLNFIICIQTTLCQLCPQYNFLAHVEEVLVVNEDCLFQLEQPLRLFTCCHEFLCRYDFSLHDMWLKFFISSHERNEKKFLIKN